MLRPTPATRLLGLVCVMTLAPVVAQPAFAGQEKTIHFRGHSTTPGCQADVKVTFDVVVGRHGLKRVEAFRATGLNYPNETSSSTEIPRGEPGSLGCYPGGPGLGTHAFLSYEDYSSVIPFGGEGTVNRSSFAADNRFIVAGTLLDEDQVLGTVRVDTKKGHTTWRAKGSFIVAASEAGLNWGISTGDVSWKATVRTKNR
ncbi:MAG: hypothetical protein U0R23_00945 [Candidatus Nanopelagicales bacterium]